MSLVKVAQREKENEPQKPTRFFSSRQERQVAKATGGTQVVNSGATPFQKGDVTTDQFLIECKTKTKASESISVQKAWFEKNKQESVFMAKPYTAVVISFGPNEENYYIIDEYLFQELQEYLSNKS